MKMKVEHRKHAVLGLVLILLLSSLVLMASAASSLRYIVSVNSAPVNLRWEPTREARVITKVKTGKTVTVLGEQGNWSKVRVDGRVGWVMTIFLSETDPLLKPEAERYILSPNSMPVNVRRDASRFSRVEDKLVTGAKVKILEVVGEWAKVQVTETGETGYVLASYLTPENPYTEEEISTTGRTVYVISEGGGDVNVREKPNIKSDLVDRVPSGTEVVLVTAGTEWSKIDTGKITGYVQNIYLGNTPGQNPNGEYTAYVLSSDSMAVNFRKEPSRNAKMIDRLVTGTAVKVLSSEGSWSKVEVKGKTGYIMNMYLIDTQPTAYKGGKTAYVSAPNGGTVRMRLGAGTGYDVVTVLETGAQVEVFASVKGWARVKCGGDEGYIDERYLSDKRP